MFTYRIEGLDKLISLRNKTEVIKEEMAQGLHNMALATAPKVRARTPKYSGDTVNSIEATEAWQEGERLMAAVESDGSVPAVVVAANETGARPHWPPWGEGTPLNQWAEDKGIPPFLVARAIARNGTIKRFGYGGAQMFELGLADSRSDIEREVVDTTTRIVQELLS